jgi:hypothetical protein
MSDASGGTPASPKYSEKGRVLSVKVFEFVIAQRKLGDSMDFAALKSGLFLVAGRGCDFMIGLVQMS